MNLNILMKDGVIEQLKTVNGKLQANTDAIGAINSTLEGEVIDALESINDELEDLNENSEKLIAVMEYIQNNTGELAEALKAMLIDNGIYFTDGKIAAISPSVYELCQTDTELKEYIKSLAVKVEAPKTLTSNDNWKFDIELISSKASDLVFYMEQGTYDSKPAYLTLNIRPDATYEIKRRGGNTFKTVDIEDAMGSRRQLTSDRPLKSTTIPVVFCNAFKYVPADKVKITIN